MQIDLDINIVEEYYRKANKIAYRRQANSINLLIPTRAELAAFNEVKHILMKYTILHFFAITRILFIDFNISTNSISIIVYYIKEEALAKSTI